MVRRARGSALSARRPGWVSADHDAGLLAEQDADQDAREGRCQRGLQYRFHGVKVRRGEPAECPDAASIRVSAYLSTAAVAGAETPGKSGGEGGIRTHGPREGTPVFKTGAFNRSATSPGMPDGLMSA